MFVRIIRVGAGGLALGLAFALAGTGPAAGQSVDWKRIALPIDPVIGTDLNRMNDLQYGRVAVKGPDLKDNQRYLRKFAKALVFPATQPSYYVFPEAGDLKARADEQNFDTALRALNGYIVAPTPANNIERMQFLQADYVTEFGVALDEALTQVLAIKDLPPVARTNAARLLAAAAKSGAPVHAKMIRAMLTDQYFKKDGKPAETPPEVLLYALKAAGNLLSAYDLAVQNSPAAARHTLPEAELLPLVRTLQDLVIKGPNVADKAAAPVVDPFGNAIVVPGDAPPPAPGAAPTPQPGRPAPVAGKIDAKTLTPEQARLVVYFRREAVRALAQCRFDVLGGVGGSKDEQRPGFTLAQVAVNDTALSLPSTPAEAADAVVGLCNMAPSASLDLPTYLAAIAGGVRLVAGPKVAAPGDRSLPWKLTAARVGRAVSGLKDATEKVPRLRAVAKPAGELADTVLADVTGRLGGDATGGAVPDVGPLDAWLANYAAWLAPTAPAGSTKAMYTDKPEFVLRPRAPGR